MRSEIRRKQAKFWIDRQTGTLKLDKKTPLAEVTIVDVLHCGYYHEDIQNISRAEKCRRYVKIGTQAKLDAYALGFEDINVSING